MSDTHLCCRLLPTGVGDPSIRSSTLHWRLAQSIPDDDFFVNRVQRDYLHAGINRTSATRDDETTTRLLLGVVF